ncbi:MAG: Nre family DNA repair protein [Candidatus Bathyarchaeia archaeon]
MKIFRKKILREVQVKVPWLEHVISDEKFAGDLNPQPSEIIFKFREGSLCIYCRGGKLLCGRLKCPILIKLPFFIKTQNLIGSEIIFGSSPPGVFVGRIGYPYVHAGPLIPPVLGDTSLLDFPEKWVGRSLEEIIGFRIKLIRGKFRANIKKPEDNQALLSRTLEIALSKDPVDIEVIFRKRPSRSFLFDDEIQPMGPSAPLFKIDIVNAKTDHRIEKVYGDHDLRAEKAVLNLYLSSIPVSVIQRAFSLGALGMKKQRRLVPTRWSITAVDSLISRRLIEDKVKRSPEISEYKVYVFNYLGNKFIILLMPLKWMYEWIEAWFPGTTWNPQSDHIAIGSNWEDYHGRSTYASLGGCYYAVRLAVAEFLAKENKQAGVVAMREVHSDYVMPLGVWINRECVREAFRYGGKKFGTLKEALEYIGSISSIPVEEWVRTSTLLKYEILQEKITKFLKDSI